VKLVLKLVSYFLQAENLIATFVEQRSPQSKALSFVPQLTVPLRNKCMSILLENGLKQLYINLQCPWPMQVKLLKNICIHGIFTISTTSYLVGFEEEDACGYDLTSQHSQALGNIDLYQL
jgi:hypothetical protein